MLTLCLSSAPSETALCLSGDWLLNQTLTFSFLGHPAHQMHEFFLYISHSVCTVCHITYSLILTTELLCLYRRGRVKNGFQLLWYCMRQEDCRCVFDSSLFQPQVRDPVKEMNRWMDRGGGAILIMFYELASLTSEATARSCHLCFCPKILHHSTHVQGNNQSINKKQNKQKAENDASPEHRLPPYGRRKQKQWQPNRFEQAHAGPTANRGCGGGGAKHNSALSHLVGFPPWNDCFTQINRLNISCILGVDRNKSFKSAFSFFFFLNKAIS